MTGAGDGTRRTPATYSGGVGGNCLTAQPNRGDVVVALTAPRVLGLVISPRTKSSFLGYERCDANAPMVLAAFLRWRHRGTFLAAWEDVAKIGTNLVRLRPGYTRYSAALRDAD